MAIDLAKITKKLTLDLSGVPGSDRKQVKKEVGEFITDEILRAVSRGKSPVEGEGSFKRLSTEYAKEFKGGNKNPNLELHGDLLNSLEFKNRRDGIEIGIFKKKEVGKADGHNNFSGKSKLPTRRFIPDGKQSFEEEITDGIDDIIKGFKKKKPKSKAKPKTERDPINIFPPVDADQTEIGLEIDDLFIRSLIEEAFNG